jgi:hypothetical protein
MLLLFFVMITFELKFQIRPVDQEKTGLDVAMVLVMMVVVMVVDR